MKVKHVHILFTFAIIFFIIYSYLPLTSPPKFISPDENIHYFFSKLYAENGTLSYTENLNKIARGVIHPRNTVYYNNRVSPAAFLGMYLVYGTIAIFQECLLLFITPLIAIIGVLFFYLLVKEIFNERVAIISSLLLFILPPYWYWSSRVMYNNIAALVSFIVGLLYFFRLLKKQSLSYYILSAVFLAISFIIVYPYILVAIPLVFLLILERKRLKMSYILISFIVFMLFTIPILLLNNDLYGSYFITGYSVPFDGTGSLAVTSLRGVSFGFISSGFRMNNIVKHLNLYYFQLIPLHLLMFFGLLQSFRKKELINYTIYFLSSSIVLISYWYSGIYYGHGFKEPILAASYVRYTLLFYVLSLPFLAYFVEVFAGGKAKKVLMLLFLLITISSVLTVFLGPLSLSFIQKKSQSYAHFNSIIANKTESDSIIFCQYWDKAIFPERKVGWIRGLSKDDRPKILADVTINLTKKGLPVYILKDRPLEWDEYDKELSKNGYLLKRIYSGHRLYKVIKQK